MLHFKSLPFAFQKSIVVYMHPFLLHLELKKGLPNWLRNSLLPSLHYCASFTQGCQGESLSDAPWCYTSWLTFLDFCPISELTDVKINDQTFAIQVHVC